MFIRILKQSFVKSKKQKFLAVLTIFLSAGLIGALLNTSMGIGDKMSSELKTYGANINVIPKSDLLNMEVGGVDYNPLKGKIFLKEKDLPRIKDIFWRNNIEGFAPFLKGLVSIDGLKNTSIVGTFFYKNVPIPDEEDYMTGVKTVSSYWKVDGAYPKDDSLEALIGADLAKKLNKKTGESLKVVYKNESIQLKITGVLHSGEDEDNAVVTSLHAVQKLLGKLGDVSSVKVSALTVPEDDLSRKSRRNPDSLDSLEYDSWYCTAYVSSIAYQIEENVPNASVKPIWQVAQSEGVVIKKIQLLMAVVTIATLFASSLGISSLMSTTIMERSREIGLMKALGATNFDVYLLFLSEAVIIGLIGGFFGFILGEVLSQVISYGIFHSYAPIKMIVLPIMLAISVIIALLGSIIPSRMITKFLPADVLYGRKK